MNTPTKEYGYITAITPEEIKALGKAKEGDQLLIGGQWSDVHSDWFGKEVYMSGPSLRRLHDPGQDHEIVPEDEARKFDQTLVHGIEYWTGKTWETIRHPMWTGFDTFRRRKSSPAMEEGWELVPKEEVNKKGQTEQLGWQYLDGFGQRKPSEKVSVSNTYRRPKSKPVEQYGWLKPDCGVEMPYGEYFKVKFENGMQGTIFRDNYGDKLKWASSNIPIASPIAFWHRTAPAPEVVKVDACEAAWVEYRKVVCGGEMRTFFHDGWQACEAHYKVGDQSKGPQ